MRIILNRFFRYAICGSDLKNFKYYSIMYKDLIVYCFTDIGLYVFFFFRIVLFSRNG